MNYPQTESIAHSTLFSEELTESEKQEIFEYRLKILPFPNMEEFYNMLQDRLHMLLDQFFLDHPFTTFVTALPRDRPIEKIAREKLATLDLISAGINKQKEMLEYTTGKNNLELDSCWQLLKSTKITGEKGKVSSKLYQEILKNDVDLNDIPQRAMGSMVSYFSKLKEEHRTESTRENPNTRQQAEFHIVNNYLSLKDYWYMSVPLIQFSEFDGIVHIVLHREDIRSLSNRDTKTMSTKVIGNIIKAFSREYESLIMKWDLVEGNASKISAIHNAFNVAREIARRRDPIFKDLKYLEYYEKHLDYFLKNIEFSDAIPGLLYKQSQKNAITTILIDSFAHNVSAHSLTALNWEFKRRIERLEKKGRQREQNKDKLQSLVEGIETAHSPETVLKEKVLPLLDNWNNAVEEGHGIAEFPRPMSRELQPLLKFLLEKGAFWSGVTRDYGFGGEINSFFDTLWFEFINNPLYLGTIANTEKISKINFRVIFYEPEDKYTEGGIVEKKVSAEGALACIDIKQSRKKDRIVYDSKAPNQIIDKSSYAEIDGERLYYSDYPELRNRSNFVNPGKNYKQIRSRLKSTMVFFPGGVVGRHALFTMLENEIRNVKHYFGSILQQLQERQNALSIVISIQEKDVEPEPSGEKELYKLGVWLDVDTHLKQQVYQADSSEYLIERRFKMLMQDIIDETETKAPRLGGNYQDKVCAAMLFNNRFRSVQLGDDNIHRPRQTKDLKRDRRYYPWIIPATSSVEMEGEDIHTDFEITREWYNKNKDGFPAFFEAVYNDQNKISKGRLKKYFHLWKGTNIKLVRKEDSKMWEWENPARFRFACMLEKEKESILLKIREFGVIRAMTHLKEITSLNNDLVEAYRMWLPKWLASENASAYLIKRREQVANGPSLTNAKYLVYKPGEEHFAYFTTSRPEGIAEEQIEELIIAHGGGGGAGAQPSDIRYRSHGLYRDHFYRIADINALLQRGSKDKQASYFAKTAEFIETLKTKVVIFDNRVSQRLQIPGSSKDSSLANQKERMYREKLNLAIMPEVLPVKGEFSEWEKAKRNLLKGVHFLVIHLTYIENILKEKYGSKVDASTSMIGFFVENELNDIYRDEKGELRENFILVVTSGRGRDEWWKKLKYSKNSEHLSYRSFITFRPVESIISVVEDNINREDDIDLKYHLVKILFGS